MKGLEKSDNFEQLVHSKVDNSEQQLAILLQFRKVYILQEPLSR